MKLIEYLIDILCYVFILTRKRNAEHDRAFYTPRNVVLFVVTILVIAGIVLAMEE
jgi:hypothetical protein